MKIIPAILAEKIEDCEKMLKETASFTDYAQIDIMDGVFVPSRSFPAEAMNRIQTTVFFEAHLMVKDPSTLMRGIHHPYLQKVIFHFESNVKFPEFIGEMKKRGIATGLAINPQTSLHEFRNIVDQVESLLFLTVDPGYYGSPFRMEVLEKIEKTKRLFPDKPISVDGGISLDNLKLFIDLNVEAVCVGSRIFLKGIPKENYMEFINKVKEMGGERST